MNFREFEEEVGQILRSNFPFGVLSQVPVYNPETREEHLYANELDHIFHYRFRNTHHLVIVECKNQEITFNENPESRAPRRMEKWFVHYRKKRPSGEAVWEASDVRDQLRRQVSSLLPILGLDLKEAPKVLIECWLVHRREDCAPLSIYTKGSPMFLAFNTAQLKDALRVRINREKVEPIPINRSVFLSTLQKAIPREGAPHPPIVDALDYIQMARKTIDRHLYRRFNGWFPSKKERWAVKGSAGSGKSMILAYTLAVFATDHRVVYHKEKRRHLLDPCDGFMPQGLVPFAQRKIVACAMSEFQLRSLQENYEMFLSVLASHAETERPAELHVKFQIWKNHIPDPCNVLIIDEAHDLDETAQKLIASWQLQQVDSRYLVIGLDRQQQLDAVNSRPFIKGLNFRYRHNMLSRTYRNPITAFMTSKALLFRWYSLQGPMYRPDLIEPNVEKIGTFKTFKGGIGVKVVEGEDHHCQIWIRNDAHPANFWFHTVDLFDSARNLRAILKLERVGKEQVLWLRFDGQNSDLEDRTLVHDFEFHRVSRENPREFVDKNIKGLEFPIVVIEGLPLDFDNCQEPDKMLLARRLFYICATRATGFLYFVLPQDDLNQASRGELERILRQFEESFRRRNDSGETWCMDFDWRPEDIIALGDYRDEERLDEEI